MNVTAIILAAGYGKRMGSQIKQLIEIDDVPMLERVIQSTRRCDFSEIITVIGNQAEKIRKTIRIEDDRFRWVFNEKYAQGQGTSLLKGIAECRTQHVMIHLGDMPFIQPQTIELVFDEGVNWDTLEPFSVRPAFGNNPGHPVFIGNIDKINFSILDGDIGAKQIIKQLPVKKIQVDDKGVIHDIDTIEVYEKYRSGFNH